jgi:predicted acylesterase/phospholipase RssA
MTNGNDDLALVLGGGGAHAAYQVGFLCCLADHFPHLRIPILTGISAGSINATFIANHPGTFKEAIDAFYPSIARIMDVLMNAIFVDMLDQDLLGLDRVNKLILNQSRKDISNLRLVGAFALRPSVNLRKMAGTFEPNLPRPFRFLTHRLGTQKTESFDWLSMIMFDSRYIQKLIEIGKADANARKEEIAAFLA